MKNGKLKKISISGTPYNRGKEYGANLSALITNFSEFLLKEFTESETTEKELINQTRKYLPFIKNYSPAIYQELQGIADGANLGLEKIAMMTLHEERLAYKNLGQACTTFAATGEATFDGSTYLGQTWDISLSLCENANPHLLEVNRENGPSYMAYTYPGMMANAGLNEAGIGISWNSLPRIDIQYGVPTYAIIENVLRQSRIGDALNAVIEADRAGCFNFVIADGTEIYSIEATPDDAEVIYSRASLGHANHYTCDRFRKEQNLSGDKGRNLDVGTPGSTIVRHNRINKLLDENSGKINLNLMKELTRDHVNYPDSICRHPETGYGDAEAYVSCATWIMDTTNKEWWIAHGGPPCENEFSEYFNS
jgi:isopenicillin-N N-acyltransferase-like protein